MMNSPPRDFSLLEGPNNADKSTVVDGLRAFYEMDGLNFKPHGDFPHIGSFEDKSWV